MLDRRSFLMSGLVAGGLGAAALSLGCAPASNSLASTGGQGAKPQIPKGFLATDFEASPVELDPITDFIGEKSYDIIVVGAGTAGIPAVLTALEEGASVACITKESTAISQGNGSSGVIHEESTDAGERKWMAAWRDNASYRVNWDQLSMFAQHSGETLYWMREQADAVDFLPYRSVYTKRVYDGDDVCTLVANMYGEKPQSNRDLMEKLAAKAEAEGCDFYYNSPAVQLVQSDDGAVTGVIAKTEEGYFKMNATKGVILATGDIQNNDSLVARYCPDALRFVHKQTGKTGDGHLMGAMAGAALANASYSRVAHDYDSAGMGMVNFPFMALDENGTRFMNENMRMEWWDTQLAQRNVDDPGVFVRVFDNAYQEKYDCTVDTETLENYIPGFKENPEGVRKDLINVHRADTLEELAGMLQIPADALQASVEEWNAMCANGQDTAFGLSAELMKPIDTPPYWGVIHWIRISAIYGGLDINGSCQVLDPNGTPIPGLYAAGSGAGSICADTEWNLYQGGMLCGWCMTSGRCAALHAATGALEPTHAGSYEAASGDWAESREKANA